MHRTHWIGALALLLAAPAAAQTFEGTVAYRLVTRDGEQTTMTLVAKGTKLRQEMGVPGEEAQAMVVITDYATGDVTMVMPPQRSYMKTNFRTMQQPPPLPDTARALADIVDTGRRETIAGYTCSVYRLQRDGTEVCVATGLGHFLAFETERAERAGRGGPGMPTSPGLARLVRTFKDGALVLHIKVPGENGTEMTATRVERGAVPNELFVVPAGYTEMRMPGMPRP